MFAAPDAHSPSPDAGSGTKVVLIVDDVWIARRTAARHLTAAGYRVYEADSAEEALTVIRQLAGRVDLLVADVIPTDLSGLEFARQLAQEWPTIRVLFMSAYSVLVLEQHGMDLSLPFIEKPFTGEGLLYKVAEVLSADQETAVAKLTSRAS